MKRKLFTIIMVIMICLIPIKNTKAQTLQDMYNELNNLKANYNAAKNKANMTQAELNRVRSEISNTENQIKNTLNEISQAEQEIVDSENSIAEKKEQTNQMLLYLQLSNNNDDSYIEYIFEAEDYTDFIYRYEVVNQLSDYNNKLIDELNTLISDLQIKKKNLADKQVELEQQKQDLQSKYAIIQVQYKSEMDDGISIQDQITQLQKSIKANEARCGGSINIDVNSCGGAAAAVDGWTYPLAHFYQSSNYGWDEDRYHYAVDLAVSEGSKVFAVANGEVKSVTTSTCGGMVIQILHYYGGTYYRSLYMHLLSGTVSTGDIVTGGQVIGYSGGGSQEIAKWGDGCTRGAHLHFTMSYGSGVIGSSASKGSTFDPVRFFPAMQGIGSRL